MTVTSKALRRPSQPSSRHFQELSNDTGDTKRLRTKALLIDTAIEVFARKGTEAASILEITETAGLSNGSFYYHFPDKDALIAEVGRSITATLIGQTDEGIKNVVSGTKRIACAVMFFIHQAAANPAWGRLISLALDERGVFQAEMLSSLKADVTLAIEQGELQAMPSLAVEAIFLGILRTAVHGRASQRPIEGIDTAATQAILSALGVPLTRARTLSKEALERLR